MRCVRLMLLALCQSIGTIGLAQETAPVGIEAAQQKQETPEPAEAKPRKFPLDVAGYLSFRQLNDDAMQPAPYREYSGSIFLSKTVGRWTFHSEFNASTAPEFDVEGLHLFRPRPSLSVKLDNAFVNYNWRDWLQVQAGFVFVPTYWRTHRYQSTTLTVDQPLMDQNVFPTSLKGVMIHGDKYFEDGGFSYELYGGTSQEVGLEGDVEIVDRSRAVAGKVVFHVPTRHFFDSADIGYHRLEEHTRSHERDHINGVELLLEKGRVRFLGEFAHSSTDTADHSPGYFQQGYYIQPSYRLTQKLFAVAEYDRLTRDSRYTDQSRLGRQSLGLVYRPVPNLSLKLEADRYEPQHGVLPAFYGASAAVVYFFRLP